MTIRAKHDYVLSRITQRRNYAVSVAVGFAPPTIHTHSINYSFFDVLRETVSVSRQTVMHVANISVKALAPIHALIPSEITTTFNLTFPSLVYCQLHTPIII